MVGSVGSGSLSAVTSQGVVNGSVGSRPVAAVISGHTHATSSVLVCSSTPCSAYLPYGEHEILLSSLSEEREATYDVTASDKPHVLRASLDTHIPQDPKRVIGATVAAGGLAAVIAGALLLGPLNHDSADSGSSGTKTADYAMIGGGLGLMAIGAVLFAIGHPAADYEGQGIVWELPAAH